MSERKYHLTIVRSDPNPNYDPDERHRNMGFTVSMPTIEARELVAAITEDELNVIKQALIKVWS